MPSEKAVWMPPSMKRSNSLWLSEPKSANGSNGVTSSPTNSNDIITLKVVGDSPVPRSEQRTLQRSFNDNLNRVWVPLQTVLAPLSTVKWHSDSKDTQNGNPKRSILLTAKQTKSATDKTRKRRKKVLTPVAADFNVSGLIVDSPEPQVNGITIDTNVKLVESCNSSGNSSLIQETDLFSETEHPNTQSKESSAVPVDFEESVIPLDSTEDSDIQEVSHISINTTTAFRAAASPSRDRFSIETFVKDPAREAKINRFVRRRGLVEYFRTRLQKKITKNHLAELILYLGYPELLVNYEHKSVKELLKLLYQEVSVSSIHRIDPRNETISDLKYCLLHSKRILVITGAGISTSLNIPDFRSPNGLYPILAQELANPADVFTLKHFKLNPELFYSVAYRTLPPENANVSVTHSFIKLLQDKGILLRDYTQNIDNLEVKAGLHRDKLVQCHGSYDGAHCIKCNHKYPGNYVFPYMRRKQVPLCKYCQPESEQIHDNVIKPDITFFGEALPRAYTSQFGSDFSSCDMLIVIGTSLQVAPISKAIHKIAARVPKVLINRELVPYDNFNYHLLGDSDIIVNFIANLMDWKIDNESASPKSCNIMKDNSVKNVYRFGS
ncbi:NAD-dependent histone deacetylase sir2 [Scheffersomyces spartinae]|uniref:NAD-dependent histone deacetylase sir2 n=1 Tax=Scheffersomyces spartinae TaxID=45513 RepID=A0A9P8AJE5_9ASCO|nr:NAD-dependent histone deacetylase sir2 [Scheffersomyces spartinae]KAG7194789.1 NAD-dependent histone deacetylase sir2 [Scheffersomyces spartinae]